MSWCGTCFFIIRSIYAALGFLSGFVGCGIFGFHFANIEAGIWAFFAAMFSGMAFFLHLLHHRGTIATWYTKGQLMQISWLGVIGFLAGIGAFIAYIVIAIQNNENHITYKNISTNHFVMSVWAGLSAKWAIILALYSCLYRKRMQREQQPLLG